MLPDNEFLKKVESELLAKLTLSGIPGITKVFLREVTKTLPDPSSQLGVYMKAKEWILDTEGINLAAVMAVDEVDYTRTSSNHLVEVLEVLGIEAVRNTLLKELRNVIEFDGSYVNYRHLAILVDIMTYQGYLMSITRHGMNRGDKSALAAASFEETVDLLFKAAQFSAVDGMQGVSENIMLG